MEKAISGNPKGENSVRNTDAVSHFRGHLLQSSHLKTQYSIWRILCRPSHLGMNTVQLDPEMEHSNMLEDDRASGSDRKSAMTRVGWLCVLLPAKRE